MTKPNAETINDLVKRFHHRLVARAIRRDPTLVEQARTVVQEREGEPRWVCDWREVLSLPVDDIRREITRPTEHMRWLRVDSPFASIGSGFSTVPQRRRIWRRMRSFAERRGL